MILRYDSVKIVTSRLDPIDDLSSWFSGLRSRGFVSDILKELHGFTDTDKTSKASKAISSHAENAINLLEQGFSGSREVCFLPIYYALLNIAKICIVLKGRQSDLEQQRFHGVAYKPRSSRDLMTEEIIFHKKGAIPLYFKSITNHDLVGAKKPVSVKMRELYPFIRSISHEFVEIYKSETFPPYYSINIDVDGNPQDGFRLKADIHGNAHLKNFNKKHIKVLNGFTLVPNIQKKKGRRVVNLTGINSYITKRIKDTSSANAQSELTGKYLRRYLLSVVFQSNAPSTITPVSNSRFSLPEELPILLAFYHMSNIVRYNPEMLDQLKDSKAWTLLLALARHGTLSFLELAWSDIQQKHIEILPR